MLLDASPRLVKCQLVLLLVVVTLTIPTVADQSHFQEAKQDADQFAKTAVALVVNIKNLKHRDTKGRVKILQKLKAAIDNTSAARLRLYPGLTEDELKQVADFENERLSFYAKRFGSTLVASRERVNINAAKPPAQDANANQDTGDAVSEIIQTLAKFTSASQPPSDSRHLSFSSVVSSSPAGFSPAQPPPPPPGQGGPAPFDNAVDFLGGNATSHCEVQCGLFGPAHSQATCDARTSHAACSCHPSLALWGLADCGCQPGGPTPQNSCDINLAPPNKQCSIPRQDVWCIQVGIVGVDQGQSTACAPGFHGVCDPAQCSGNTFTPSFSMCKPDQ
jgi:hypothetical protein